MRPPARPDRATLLDAMKEPGAREFERIRAYVEAEVGAPITVAERVATEKVLGHVHETWNVHTDDGSRWWVITNLTNMYSREDFPQAGVALTYHLGLQAILAERSRAEREAEGRQYAAAAWRKYEKAAETFNAAQEAEDFQAVGVQCREALIALIQGQLDDDWNIPPSQERPRNGDFKAWARIYALNLTENRRVRAYMEAVSDKTWDLVVWLQHYTDATPRDAEMALDATANVLSSYCVVMVRFDEGLPQRCPVCESYRVRTEHDKTPTGDWVAVRACLSCEHEWPLE